MEKEETSYRQIARSTGIFGGSQILVILAGLIRTKLLAVLLGTTGVGLNGLFQSIPDLIRSFTGMGLGFSAVKDIAAASQTGDELRIAHTVRMLNRWLWWTGTLGMLLTIAFSPVISQYMFNDNKHVLPVCLLSLVVLAGTVTSGKMALLQGMRKISFMAKASLYSALAGLLTAVPLFYWLGNKGIVPALLLAAFVAWGIAEWFSGKIPVKKDIVQPYKTTLSKGKAMVKLGLFTVASSLLNTLVLFLLRRYILQYEGVESVGLFQAVTSITNLYIGGLLASMAADYYPRLCSQTRNDRINAFANEQTRFVLVVATPLICSILLLAQPILDILYSHHFQAATNLLQWQVTGIYLKVMIWPIGFILLSKGKGGRFLLVEIVWQILYCLFSIALWPTYGLDSAGIAFVIAYIVYLPLVYSLVKPLCNFKTNRRNIAIIAIGIALVFCTFIISFKTNGLIRYVTGTLLLLTCYGLSLFELNRILPFHEWVIKLRKRLKNR